MPMAVSSLSCYSISGVPDRLLFTVAVFSLLAAMARIPVARRYHQVVIPILNLLPFIMKRDQGYC